MGNHKLSDRECRIGLGCMGMSEFYGDNDDHHSLNALHKAFELGYRHFDTADMYGKGHNETLLGSFIKDLGSNRSDAYIATKVGIKRDVNGPGTIGIDNSPEYILKACDESLDRLNLDQIDLYTLHRRDPNVPIAETMDAMKQLQDMGKIKEVGLCEVSADTLKKANDVVKITALQSEYSLWSRNIEDVILPMCIELGVHLVAYSPIGRGFLSGKISKEQINNDNDLRSKLPRFQADAFDHNEKLLSSIRSVAEENNCTLAQVALAWLLEQNPLVSIIPGGRKFEHLQDNINSAQIKLPESAVKFLSDEFSPERVSGLRYPEPLLKTTNT